MLHHGWIPFWSFHLFQVCFSEPMTAHSVMVFLDPVTVAAEGPSCVSGQGEACIPQMTPTACYPHQQTHARSFKEAISVMSHTPYCSLTYWRYRTAHWLGESSGATFKAMQLWGTYRDTAFCLPANLLIHFLNDEIIVWGYNTLSNNEKTSCLMKSAAHNMQVRKHWLPTF